MDRSIADSFMFGNRVRWSMYTVVCTTWYDIRCHGGGDGVI